MIAFIKEGRKAGREKGRERDFVQPESWEGMPSTQPPEQQHAWAGCPLSDHLLKGTLSRLTGSIYYTLKRT